MHIHIGSNTQLGKKIKLTLIIFNLPLFSDFEQLMHTVYVIDVQMYGNCILHSFYFR